ncbi:hypothetical protein FHR83_000834 [Actinoplanes campanulatus]|uniref:Uncharacterized protein n=1 Tax=Actinoplanes campanulatus TaxID=113559 RepID=A0A7W5AC08_9ACTN|nr:hypothetical protein [Actinoplanes campanulatus]MBB3093200.1 hypothetical protein [Actinoplanes campanulatus]GGN01896.1 hypothetical protein GCM10010109_07620 [Actinoplanes campanulatus]GID33704.1 hypothetical protein Aca09nite_02100 [Actinoplanes campanulatus]
MSVLGHRSTDAGRDSADGRIVTGHYRRIWQGDPLCHMPGRENRLVLAWADLDAYMTGIDTEAYSIDPLPDKSPVTGNGATDRQPERSR